MPQGYNIDCDAGSLYYRNCYIIDASGARNEIIGYTHNGDPVTKSATSAAGAAWSPQIFALNSNGQQYQPYKGGNIPFGYLNFTPSTNADPQDLYYLNHVMPGAESFRKQQHYTAKWWMPTFGLRKASISQEDLAVMEESGSDTPQEFNQIKRTERDAKLIVATSVGSIIVFGIVNKFFRK
jgi:hypothetical protein|tara:strand:- start:275 stop:817 length:543 start_codon:yes stop_codon:yes gene_type:complete